MSNNRVEIDSELLDKVSGGAIGFDPSSDGTYVMRCQYSGSVFYGVALGNCIEIAKFGATIPNTAEGEQEIINFALANGYISY